jgi:hypothetical protein
MGKNKNDFEASDSDTKKEGRQRVPLPINVARLMHANWTPCDGWWTCTCLTAVG